MANVKTVQARENKLQSTMRKYGIKGPLCPEDRRAPIEVREAAVAEIVRMIKARARAARK